MLERGLHLCRRGPLDRDGLLDGFRIESPGHSQNGSEGMGDIQSRKLGLGREAQAHGGSRPLLLGQPAALRAEDESELRAGSDLFEETGQVGQCEEPLLLATPKRRGRNHDIEIGHRALDGRKALDSFQQVVGAGCQPPGLVVRRGRRLDHTQIADAEVLGGPGRRSQIRRAVRADQDDGELSMRHGNGIIGHESAFYRSVKRLWILLVFAIGAAGPLRAQESRPATEIPTYSETAGSEYVMLPVVVFDRKGRFVEGLSKKDFTVRADGVPVEIDTFERDDTAPVSIAFLIDTSGSMRLADKLDASKRAVRRILEQRRPGDDFALFAFSEEEVRLVSDFSPDPERLLEALSDLEAEGRTALFDAVAATPSRLMKGRNSKRAILLFTDGVDNSSHLTALQMAEILQQVSTPVYPIGMKNAAFDRLSEQERRDLALDNLKLLASSSGGQLLLVGAEDDLRPIATKIFAEVRQQYLLGFAPSGRGELKYRVVVVSVAKKGWSVRARRGYRGTAPVAVVKHEGDLRR